MRVAIYSRYSSDLQSETSASDQARLCRQRAEREGWTVVGNYADEAISGQQVRREGLDAMLASAADIDIVLAEDMDRLSRDQEDIAAIYKRLTFAGVKIVTLADGEINELHVGLKGTMSALFIKGLAAKTRRGQIGRVAVGRIPGGLSYGYNLVRKLKENGDPDRGLRTIDPQQAAIVRRIYAEHAAGRTVHAIVTALNAEKVPAPRGGLWRVSVLTGTRNRRNGILRNSLYAGVITYNRQRFDRDPITRKRVARANRETEWVRQDVPELQIVDTAVWQKVQDRLAMNEGVTLRRAVRPKSLLSGLLRCSECGGGFNVIFHDRWGCGTARDARACDNRRTITTAALEERVLQALKEEFAAPDYYAEYVREYHAAAKQASKQRARDRGAYEKRLKEAEGRVARLAEAIASGGADFVEIKDLLKAARIERDEMLAELADEPEDNVIALHPRLADTYRRNFDNMLARRGEGGLPEIEANEGIRGLVDTIVVWPRLKEKRGVDLEVRGHLAGLIAMASGKPISTVNVVAGVGFRQGSAFAVPLTVLC